MAGRVGGQSRLDAAEVPEVEVRGRGIPVRLRAMRMPSPAAVVFAADVARVAAFYRTLFGMRHVEGDATYVVLERDGFQLTIHGLRGEPAATGAAREDTYVKLCFPVDSLAGVRREAAALGGALGPAGDEWESDSRGFRACDGRDPEGNVFQAREPLAG